MPGLGLAIALVVMTAADQAGAAVTVFRWSGYVEGGTDTGVYLPGGGNLTGLKFTYTAVVNDDIRTPFDYQTAGVISDIYGGSVYGAGAPSPVSGVMTINGVSSLVTGDYFGQQTNQINASNTWGNGHYRLVESRTDSIDPVTGELSETDLYVIDTLGLLPISWDYHDPASFSLATTGAILTANGGGVVGVTRAYVSRPDGSIAQAQADVVTTRLTISSGVPEPAAWTLMLTGIGGLGACLRARRRRPFRPARPEAC